MKKLFAAALAALFILLSACGEGGAAQSASAPVSSAPASSEQTQETPPEQGTVSVPVEDEGVTEKETLTFTVDGQEKGETAGRVILEKCDILVPTEGWGHRVENGSLVISPNGVDGVSLSLQIMETTITDEAREVLLPDCDTWAEWQHVDNGGNTYTADKTADGVTTRCIVIESHADSIVMTAVFPEADAAGVGANLGVIAGSIRIF